MQHPDSIENRVARYAAQAVREQLVSARWLASRCNVRPEQLRAALALETPLSADLADELIGVLGITPEDLYTLEELAVLSAAPN